MSLCWGKAETVIVIFFMVPHKTTKKVDVLLP
jgi:hypothetical protein